MIPVRNLAILAHVDAGKTTLSERILFNASEIRRVGEVEDGLATMDYLPEEKERGITIESGVAHYEWKNLNFNFIDTPGHIDFGAEVDSALSIVDASVLVVAASGGVETQTMSAWQKLKVHHLKPFIFINKLDNPDYSFEETLLNLEECFETKPVLLTIPEFKNGELNSVLDLLSGTRLEHDESGKEIPRRFSEKNSPRDFEKYFQELLEAASEVDDNILEALLENRKISSRELRAAIQKLFDSPKHILCYAGSAKKNFGIRSLMTALALFAPPPKSFNESELGTVFRLRHFKEYGEVALFQAHSSLEHKDFPNDFQFFRLRANFLQLVETIHAGDIYALRTKQKLELGNVLSLNGNVIRNSIDFKGHYEPLLQTHLECSAAEEFFKIDESLFALARMEPSIRIERQNETGSWILHTIGEVQLEVLLERLKREFNCDVQCSEPDVHYQERLVKPVENFKNQFQAGEHKITVTLSAIPIQKSLYEFSFENLNEEESQELKRILVDFAEQGILGKGPLLNIHFHLNVLERTSNISLGMLKKVFADAFILGVPKENVAVFEPIMELFAETPVRFAGMVTQDVHFREGKINEVGGDGKIHFLYASIPLRKLLGYATSLRSITQGAGIYSMRFLEYRKQVLS